MPQNSLIDPPEEGLRMEVQDLTWEGDPGFRFLFAQKKHGAAMRTVEVVTLRGLEVDFAGTLLKEAAHAWLYGGEGDVYRAVRGVVKQARAHARAHEADATG